MMFVVVESKVVNSGGTKFGWKSRMTQSEMGKKLEGERQEKFDRMMDLVVERHPYYRSLISRLGLHRTDFMTIEDLRKLPVTTKSTYMSDPEAFCLDMSNSAGLSLPERTLAQVIYTTGSTAGRPAAFYDTNFDHASRIAQMKAVGVMLGLGPEDTIANLFPLTAVLHQGFFSALYAGLAAGAKVFSTFTGQRSTEFDIYNSTSEACDLLRVHSTTVLWGIAGYVLRIVTEAVGRGIDLSGVHLVFLAGEPVSESTQEELRRTLLDSGAPDSLVIENGYGFTEMQGPGVRCHPGSQLHLPAPDQFWFETIDAETHGPMSPGEVGLLAITHLNRRGTVLLRYVVGDLCAIEDGVCPFCGRVGPRLASKPRRIGDLVKVKGTLVNTAALVEALQAIPGTGQTQVRLRRSRTNGDADELVVYVVAALDAEADLFEQIRQVVRRDFEITATVETAPLELRDELLTNYKVRRFLDERALVDDP